MKKLLYILGFGTLGYGAYRYFKYQIDLALKYEYDISGIKILTLNTEKIDVQVDIKLSNKSSFEVEVLNYDINISYKNVAIAHTESGTPFRITPESSVYITTVGTSYFNDVGKIILPFAQAVLKKQPIDIEVSGSIKIKFLGIPHTINLDKQKVNYTTDLLSDIGLAEKYDKLKEKIPLLRKF